MSLVPDYDSDSCSDSDATCPSPKRDASPGLQPLLASATAAPRFPRELPVPHKRAKLEQPTTGGLSNLLSLLPAPVRRPAKQPPSDLSDMSPLPTLPNAPMAGPPRPDVPPSTDMSFADPYAASATASSEGYYYDPSYYQYYYGYDYSQAPSDPSAAPTTKANDLDSAALRRLGGRRALAEGLKFQEVAQSAQLVQPGHRPTAQFTPAQPSAAPVRAPDHLKPTQGQKRKNNIMSLAFESIENEGKVKELYASGRQSKRETQAKYGF
ncbi:hypothetical protein H4R33_003277 [Dimargaris cristalligena]|nr:hypothetical protein H4R33_003277 [Dimargaris cristalligena]